MTRQSARLTVLQNRQESARATLEELKADLPRFHSLLTDNEREAERLRRERADLSHQADAKGRVTVAREMLEQHRSDIQSAQAELERITAEVEREQVLSEMAWAATEAKRYRAEIEAALKGGSAAMQKHLKRLDEADRGFASARQTFLERGGRFSPLFRREHGAWSWTPEQNLEQEHRALGILEELRSSGVDLDDVLTPHNVHGRRSAVDLPHPDRLAPDTFGTLLYKALLKQRGLED